MELVGHRRVLAQQPLLVGAEAVVDVVAVLQVHARFPEVHAARFEHAADERLHVDLQVEDQVRGDGEAVEVCAATGRSMPRTPARASAVKM